MAIVLADNTPRIEYTVAQGVTQTVFPIPFAFFNKEDSSNVDVKVFVDGVERTLGSISTTTFSITSGGNGAKGSLSTTVTGASGGSTVIVLRDTKIGRTTDFPSGGAFEVSKLNTELDTLVAIEGDFEDHVSRSIRLQDKDTAVSLALPLKADRLGKQLGFNATTGAVQMFTPESLAIASDSGSSSVDLTSNTFTFTGGEGIDTSISNQTLTITGELASTSNKGVASFGSTFFDVSSGAVTLKAAQTGITSLLATDIKIGEDDQTKIDFETADQINFYANNVNVVQLSNANSGDAVFTVPTSNKNFEIKGNDGGSTITALTIDMSNSGDASFNNNVTVGGNLIVNGSSTQVNTATLTVEDPLISLAKSNDSSDSLDIGFYGLYDTSGSQDLYAGLFRDASDSGKFKLFKDLQAEPTTTVNTGGTGYAVGTLVANLEGTIQTAAQSNITSLGTLTGLTIDGDATFTGTSANILFDKSDDSLKFADNVKAKFGTGADLQIYHDGSDSYIQETGVGNLVIRTSDFRVRTADNTAFLLRGSTGGDVRLFYNGSQKFITEDTGAKVTGTLTADGISLGDSELLQFGASNDLQIHHNGNNSFITDSGTGALIVQTNHFKVQNTSANKLKINALENLQVELYYNGNKKFETTSAGATVTGTVTDDGAIHDGDVTFTGTNGNIVFDKSADSLIFQDNVIAKFGTSGDLFIQHDGSNSFITDFGTGGLFIGGNAQVQIHKAGSAEKMIKANADSSVELYYDNVKQFETSSTGASIRPDEDDVGLIVGKAYIGHVVHNTYAAFSHQALNDNQGAYALLQSASGQTLLNAATGQLLQFRRNNVAIATFETDGSLNLKHGLTMNDNDKAIFGTDGDLEIYHDGSNSFISDTGTGDLVIQATHLRLRSATAETYFLGTADGSVELYHNNVKKIETTSTGATVTGDLLIRKDDDGASQDPTLVLYRNSASPADNDFTGDILFQANNDNSEVISYAQIHTKITDASDGNESGFLQFKVMQGGSFDVYGQMAFNNFYVFKQLTMFNTLYISQNNIIKFEGSSNNANETTLTVTDPTADRTITLPDASGDIVLNESGTVNISSTADGGPILNLVSNDPSDVADFNTEATIAFKAENSANQEHNYAEIRMMTDDVTDGTEDGRIRFHVASGSSSGGLVEAFDITSTRIQIRNSLPLEFSNAGGFGVHTSVQVATPSSTRTITLPDATGTVLTTGNSDTPTTTTSSSDADFVLVDDGGTMKKITPSNLGIGSGGSGSSAADDITAGDAAVNITTTSGNITIDAQGSDTDIIFKGTDGGADRTFLTFDGSTNTADFTQDSTAVEVASGQLFVMNGSNYARLLHSYSTNVGITLPSRTGILALTPAFIQVYLSSNSSALTTSYVTIVFDQTPEQDSESLDGVIYNATNGEFSITRAMTLKVHADITTDVTSGSNRSDTQARLEKEPSGGSFSQVAGTEAHAYNRNADRGEQTMTIDMIVSVAQGDKLRFTCKQAGGTDTVVIRGDATRANMVEIT